jgi:phosphate-selective porin OprO/OprP
VITDFTTVHLGVWGRVRNRGDQANFTYQVRNNTNYGARYTSSGAIGVSDKTVGLEAVVLHKQFSVQSEYARITANRTGTATDVDLDSFYVTGSFFLTGETRRYEAARGEFNRTRILNPMTGGGMGALEAALRYDSVDLTDLKGVATAGKYTAWTAGLNWYPHPYVRFQANYTKSKNDNPTLTSGTNLQLNDVDVDTFQMRAQFDF